MDAEWKSPWGALISALRDAFAVLSRSFALYAGLAIAGVLIDVFVTPLHPFVFLDHHWTATDIAMTVASYFALANAVRTLAPRYAMTALDLLAMLGLSILLVLGIALGCFLLIVPGFFVIARFGPLPYVYLLGRAVDAEDGPFERTLDATAERGWQTLGLFIMIGITEWIVGTVADRLGVPASGLGALAVFNLVYFAAGLWASQVTSLAILRWVAVEEPKLVGGPDERVPVPAAP
ncbi:MAG TPA: hypothetical protein VIG46_11105 [Candidatus Baltobacteraceae bacterium]|jgi:hypothetical protein